MKNTKANFEFTATLINAAKNGANAENLADLAVVKFAAENPLFDADRFKRACGLSWSQIDKKNVPQHPPLPWSENRQPTQLN